MSAQDTMNTTTKKAANSIVGKLTALILAGAAAVLLTGTPAAAQNGGGRVLVVGDSLQVGTGPYLEQELGATFVDADDEQSRGSGAGLAVLRARLRPEHSIVVYDLGTNDDPSNPDALYANLQSAVASIGDRCLVVATLLKPPSRGFGVDGLNAAVVRFVRDNPGVQLVDWHGAATSTPGLLYEDGVHARPEGYALRGRLVAEGVARCGRTDSIPAPARRIVKPRTAKLPAPAPPPEVAIEIEPPATLVAIATVVRHAAALLSAAGRDARQAAGLGPPEPVLGAE